MDNLLENSLDYGLSELEFWEMTPGEVVRLVNSRYRVRKLEAKEKATYDYVLANLIVKGFSIVMGSKDNFPALEEAYPKLFDEEVEARDEQIQEQKEQLSVLRFKQFAQSYNKKFKNKEVPIAE